MISVLLPSRQRLVSLRLSIASLVNLAADPGQVEVLVGCDPDDTPTHVTAKIAGAVTWTAPCRYGYAGLHHYFNQLARIAAGDWLLHWNDDAVMLTQGWDTIIRSCEPAVLWPEANHHQHLNLFPAWPRAWAAAIGHVSLCCSADSWVSDLGERVGRHVRIPVQVRHDRFDVTGKHFDATAFEGSARAEADGLGAAFDELAAEREADARVIRELLG